MGLSGPVDNRPIAAPVVGCCREERAQMQTISRRAWLQRIAVSMGFLLCMAAATRAQSPTLSTVLTGQSLLRWGLPTAAPTITSLLKGDAVFTNFEATVFDPRKKPALRTHWSKRSAWS